MTTLTQKLAALGMALVMNGALAGTVAYLFKGQLAQAEAVAVLRATV